MILRSKQIYWMNHYGQLGRKFKGSYMSTLVSLNIPGVSAKVITRIDTVNRSK